MMMTFPPGPHVTDELPTLPVGGLIPQSTDIGAHRVERCLPVDTALDGQLTLLADLANQLPGAANAVILTEKIRPFRRLTSHVGQQSVTGIDLNGPPVSGLFERYHGIDHGQPGTDDQYPRSADPARA